jgi:hypothetical protein
MAALMAGLGLAAEDRGRLRVFVFDYAEVSPAVLQDAKGVASAILDTAGVEVEWADCSVPAAAQKQSSCDWYTPMDIQLRILSAAMAKRVGTTKNCLGYAVTAKGLGSVAGVYFHRAIDLENEAVASRAQILGGAMAHEIGHLLLPDGSHSAEGLMRGDWSKSDLKLLGQGRLGFDHTQARRIVSMAQERAQRRERRAAANSGLREARFASATLLP